MATILEKANKILNEKEQKIRPENLKQGVSYFDVDGALEELKGQTKTVEPTIERQTITPDETYNGFTSIIVNAVTNAIDSNIQEENIKKGTTILGITGTLETGSGGGGGLTGTFNPSSTAVIFNDITPLKIQNDWHCPQDTKFIPTDTNGISLLDTSEITSMNPSGESGMFFLCSNLEYIPLLNTTNVTSMAEAFQACFKITIIPKFDTTNVKIMRGTFNSCRNLVTIPLLNTLNVVDMSGMFGGCESLLSIPKLNTVSVEKMPSMFRDCNNLSDVPELDTNKVTVMSGMFRNCNNLSDNSLNNILAMCSKAVHVRNGKRLSSIGLSAEQIVKCRTLSNYQAFIEAGWAE